MQCLLSLPGSCAAEWVETDKLASCTQESPGGTLQGDSLPLSNPPSKKDHLVRGRQHSQKSSVCTAVSSVSHEQEREAEQITQ